MLDEAAKKSMLRKIPHGLFICGVRDGDQVNGFTASWVTQGSFTPPLVVCCVRADSTSNGMIRSSGVFALTVLDSSQKDVAAKFFKPQAGIGGRFEDLEFRLGETGCPILVDSLGYVECRVTGEIDQGDHTIFVGEVIAAGEHRQGEGLTLAGTGWNYGG